MARLLGLRKGEGRDLSLWSGWSWTTRTVVLATLFGLALRAYGLTWGLPDKWHLSSYHPDEWTIFSHASRIVLTGDFNPHFFNYGSLPIYLSAAVLWITRTASDLPSPQGILVIRALSALAGVITIPLAASVARRALGSAWAGAGAALFCAVTPVHVMCSQFGTVDAIGACFLTASVAVGLRLLEDDRRRWYALAGLFAGLAAATKYVGVLAVLPAYAAHMARRRDWRGLYDENALLIPLAAGLAFAVACPYALLDYGTFRADFAFEARHIRQGATTEMMGKPPLWFFVSEALPCALGWPMLALSGLSLGLVLLRRRAGAAILAAWCVLLCLLHGSGREIFVRYVVPIAPFLAAAYGALFTVLDDAPNAGLFRGAWRRGAVAAMAAVGLMYGALLSAGVSAMMASVDSRDTAGEYLRQQLAHGGSLGLANAPWFYTPPVLMQNLGPAGRPELVYEEADQRGIDLRITGWDANVLRLEPPPDWYAISEFEYYDALRRGDPDAVAFFEALDRDYDLVLRVEGRTALGPLVFPRPRLHDWRYVSPETRVYRRKAGASP